MSAIVAHMLKKVPEHSKSLLTKHIDSLLAEKRQKIKIIVLPRCC